MTETTHAGGFLAIDWGTTRLRAWVVDGAGRAGARRDFDLGVGRLAPGEAAERFRAEVRPALGAERLPVLMAGMIGSTLGWREAPYLDCPVDAAALARGLLRIPGEPAPTAIAPGLRCRRPDLDAPDVMRGEEVQVMGWLALDPARGHGRRLVCHPGTHAKWVDVEDGRVVRFLTSMTGELYELLTTRSTLRGDPALAPPGPEAADAAFDRGVDAAGDGAGALSRLFTARSLVVGGGMDRALAPAYLSGLLIGADVAASPAALGFGAQTEVALVGAPALTRLYARALGRHDVRTTETEGDAAVLAGLVALHAAVQQGPDA